jgi:hypothetical protein
MLLLKYVLPAVRKSLFEAQNPLFIQFLNLHSKFYILNPKFPLPFAPLCLLPLHSSF